MRCRRELWDRGIELEGEAEAAVVVDRGNGEGRGVEEWIGSEGKEELVEGGEGVGGDLEDGGDGYRGVGIDQEQEAETFGALAAEGAQGASAFGGAGDGVVGSAAQAVAVEEFADGVEVFESGAEFGPWGGHADAEAVGDDADEGGTVDAEELADHGRSWR